MTLLTLLERAASQRGDAPAVIWRGNHHSWSELMEASQRVAATLRRLGIEPGDRVMIWLDKGPRCLEAVWGVLYAGATYVPVDLTTPPERLVEIAQQAHIKAVITRRSHLRWLLARTSHWTPTPVITVDDEVDDEPLPYDDIQTWSQVLAEPRWTTPAATPASLAYILFTSGSTGTPKGVCHTHASALAFARWAADAAQLVPTDRLSHHAGLHFDLSTFDLFASAAVGAAVCPIPEAAAFRGAALLKFVQEAQITVWYSVPMAIQQMAAAGKDAIARSSLRTIIFAGEAFPVADLRRLRDGAPRVRLLNFYGPTETNVCTWYEVPKHDPLNAPIPIGIPCDGTSVRILDDQGLPVSLGETGEVVVQGPTVMRGYLGELEGTVHRPVLVDGECPAYRTGDRGRRDSEGLFHLVGRLDGQVKVRGHRVELGEIESLLGRHEVVRAAAAWVHNEQGQRPQLAAAVELASSSAEDGHERTLCAHLALYLPPALIPSKVHVIERLVRSGNGKVDRERTRRLVAPRDP